MKKYEFPKRIATAGRAEREFRRLRRAIGVASGRGDQAAARHLAGRLARAYTAAGVRRVDPGEWGAE